MAEELVTIKTSEKARRTLRLICAQHGLKQYEAMEILFEAARWGKLADALDKLLEERAKTKGADV